MVLCSHNTSCPCSPSTDLQNISSQPLELALPAVSRDIEPQHARSEPSLRSSIEDCLHHRRDRSYPLQPSIRGSRVGEVCRHSRAVRARGVDEVAEEDGDRDRLG